MDNERWDRIQSLFHAVADREDIEQAEVLGELCVDDRSLITDVISLLQQDAQADLLLDRSLSNLAGTILDSESGQLPFLTFGPYKAIRLLGEGGMGLVYLAEHTSLQRLVAIKVLRDGWWSPFRRSLFLTEQRTLAQLDHPYIARLYDTDELPDGTPMFVMEYVAGLPVTEYCRRLGHSIRQRLELFRKICEAVQFAHSQAVIHRDLKPSNILIKQDGSVRLLDFGIAKQLKSGPEQADTKTVQRLITPVYASPEQIRGERAGTHTDVHALGVILYELLAGRLPFNLSNQSPQEVELLVLQTEAERPSQSPSRARSTSGQELGKPEWADLDVLCLKAMNKDPERRYGTVDALIRDIDHFLAGEPLDARPDDFSYKARKFVRRHQRGVLAIAGCLVLLAGMAIFFTVRLARARDAALSEAARAERIEHFLSNLFEGGDAEAGPSDSLRVVTLLDRGVKEARTLNGDPAVQAELYETLGTIYQGLGKLDRAELLIRKALEERQSTFGRDSERAGESLVALGSVRSDQGRLPVAERLTRQGLEMEELALPPSHPEIGKTLHALGEILDRRGAYDQAITVLNKAVALQSRPEGVRTDLSASLTELANVYFYSGRHAQSEQMNKRVLAMDLATYGEGHPNVAQDYINLGELKEQAAQYSQSEQYLRRALAIDRQWFGDQHPETASCMTLLAQSLVYESKYDEAESLLKEAVKIQEKTYGRLHARVALALNALGQVAVHQHHFADAESDYKSARDIYKAIYADKHYYIAVTIANLADLYSKTKRYAEAEQLFAEAIRRLIQTQNPNHVNVGIARFKLGRTLVREGRYIEAKKELSLAENIFLTQSQPPKDWLDGTREQLAKAEAARR